MNNSSLLISKQSPASQGAQILGWIIGSLVTNFFGVAANVVLLLALAVHQPLHQSASIALIAHCVVIDLIATAVAIPIDIIPVYLGPHWHLPVNYCKFEGLYVYVVYAASMYASSILAIHRLIAVVLPFYFTAVVKKSVLIGLIILPWFISVLINIFPTMEVGLKIEFDKAHGGCVYAVTSRIVPRPFLLYTIFLYYLPTVIMGLSYSVVIWKTSKEMRRKKGSASQALKRRLEISRTLFLSVIWHCITIYPINLVVVLAARSYATNLSLQLGVRWLSTSFGAMNPLFLWASSKMFQEGIKEVLRCRWLRRYRRRGVGPISRSLITPASLPEGLRTSHGLALIRHGTERGTLSKY